MGALLAGIVIAGMCYYAGLGIWHGVQKVGHGVKKAACAVHLAHCDKKEATK